MTDQLELLSDLLDTATAAGADAADAVTYESTSLSVRWRLGELEQLERSESRDLGLRVFVGRRQAIVSSSDLSPETLREVVERVVAMARVAPEDSYCGLADPGQLIDNPPEIDIDDAREPETESLVEVARAAEETARAVKGITNSEGSEAGWSRGRIAIAATNGFARSYGSSQHSLGACVLAGEGLGMERDYDYSVAVYRDDLANAEEIGRNAGERAVRRLGARKVETCQVPVVYDPRVSRGLLSHFAGAVNGSAISRGTSFLLDSMDERVFGSAISIVDEPHRARGLNSKPFDAEGVANDTRLLVEGGVLKSWVLDLASGRQLGLDTTGHASRGTSAPPAPSTTNLYMEPGSCSREELMADIVDGLYVTELIGMGVNMVTGDYSRGATGFWIENGEIAYPVSEMTIAGNLKDMFLRLDPADDLKFLYGINAPTIRIDGMTVAGV